MPYALVFPGQGSQALQMLAPWARLAPDIVIEYCTRASVVLGYNIAELIATGPEAQLNQTEYTQPALLLAGVIAWQVWQQQVSLPPAYLAGHSLGEYTALTCAGSLTFEDAIALVRTRGRLMQAAVPEGEGAMAAIVGLENAQVEAVCSSLGSAEDIAIANFNSIGQVVVAGRRTVVDQAILEAKARGAKIARLLPMSVPSHCRLLLPAAQWLENYLANVTVGVPRIPVINNVDVIAESDPAHIKQALSRQLCAPVRWVDVIQAMQHQGVTSIFECGPGSVLTGLTKRIDKTLRAYSVGQAEAIESMEAGGSIC